MSEGLMCLKCRRYITTETDSPYLCHCNDPAPSLDGKTPINSTQIDFYEKDAPLPAKYRRGRK